MYTKFSGHYSKQSLQNGTENYTDQSKYYTL